MPEKKTDIPKKIYALSWSAAEFGRYERGPVWYGIASAAFIALEALGYFLLHDVLFMAILVIVVLLVAYLTILEPRDLDYGIDDEGFTVGSMKYLPQQIKSYWFSHEPGTVMHLEIKGRPLAIMIPVPDEIDEKRIREAMEHVAKEDKEKQEDLFARLLRLLKI